MPQPRTRLREMETADIDVVPAHKEAVLRLLVQDPDVGYELGEVAAETPVQQESVFKVLQQLRDEDLVEKLFDHYLINADREDEIKDLVLDSMQLRVAEDISNKNTAPDEVPVDDPDTDLFSDGKSLIE